MRNAFRCIAVWVVFAILPVPETAPAQHQVVEASQGMVASRHPLASQVGADVLAAGGHVVDAAVAVAAALAVVLPQAGNVGGGGFLLYFDAASKKTTFLDFRETAPARAHRDMYLTADGGVDAERARVGHLAVGVPGSVAGWHRAWQQFGTRRWEELLEDAIELSAVGFSVNAELATILENEKDKLRRFAATKAIFFESGRPKRQGERIVQPDLSETLRQIARDGPHAFYRGEIAKQLVADMQAHGGMLSLEDLDNYRVETRQELRGQYKDLEIICAPPPSSGGVTLLQILAMLENFELVTEDASAWRNVHIITECMRRAFADRNAHLGDPEYVRIPGAGLLAREYSRRRASEISIDRATPSNFVRAGPAWDFSSESAPQPDESNETTHISIVDRNGNIVAMTTTLNSNFGSGVTVPGTGILLNNQMDDFVAKPGVPNQYGLIGNANNAIAPGRRMLSSMAPTIVLRSGQPWLVLGARGGPRIISTVLHILLNRYEFDMTLAEAVHASRYHHQWLPDQVSFETGAISKNVRSQLALMGHHFVEIPRTKSSAQCIEIDGETTLIGVSDPRTDGRPAGH